MVPLHSWANCSPQNWFPSKCQSLTKRCQQHPAALKREWSSPTLTSLHLAGVLSGVTSFLYTHPSLKFGLLTLLSKQPKKCSLWIEGAIHHLRLYFLVASHATAFCPFKLSNLQLIRHHPAVQPLRPWSEFQIGSRSLDPAISKDQQGVSLSTISCFYDQEERQLQEWLVTCPAQSLTLSWFCTTCYMLSESMSHIFTYTITCYS